MHKYDMMLKIAELEQQLTKCSPEELATLKKEVASLKEENEKLDRSRDYYKGKYESLKAKQDASKGDK